MESTWIGVEVDPVSDCTEGLSNPDTSRQIIPKRRVGCRATRITQVDKGLDFVSTGPGGMLQRSGPRAGSRAQVVCLGVVTRTHTVDRLKRGAATNVVDLFVYVVVLNLFIEYLPQVLSESFTLTLLTAVLLKIVLELVVAAEHWVRARFREASKPIGKVVAGIALWAVLVGSKFLVLEVTHLVFGGRVRLGGFFSVFLLILALLVSRLAVRRLLVWATPDAQR